MKSEKKINVWDFVMGSGKTTKFKKIINKNPNTKFLFVTPFLDEVELVKRDCNNFYEPNSQVGRGTKRKHFLMLVKAGVNIATTHALFRDLNIEDYSLLNEYTLVLDEVMEVVKTLSVSKRDTEMLFNDGVLHKDPETDKVIVLEETYEGAYEELWNHVKTGGVKHEDNTSFIWMFPIEIFQSFNQIFILTFLFEGSFIHYYFKYHEFEHQILSEHKPIEKELIKAIMENVDVYHGKYNRIGGTARRKKSPLTVGWHKNATKKQFDSLNKATRNFFETYCKTSSEHNAYTTFKDYKLKVKGWGYTEGLISVNARATNEFMHKTSMAYLVDRRMNPSLKRAFENKGIIVNEDLWSLGEMVQWIWRGCIRDGKPMKVFIPSLRMRNLLLDWANGK